MRCRAASSGCFMDRSSCPRTSGPPIPLVPELEDPAWKPVRPCCIGSGFECLLSSCARIETILHWACIGPEKESCFDGRGIKLVKMWLPRFIHDAVG